MRSFVADAEHRFARVAERAVTDVVQQQARAQQPPLVGDVGIVAQRHRGDAVQS